MPPAAEASARDVFCNFPFDEAYEKLYLALISALLCTGQTPRTVLEIPPDAHRLERLVALVDACPYSIHDLSRVQLSSGSMRVPRFNMPFELGLAVSAGKRSGGTHQFRVVEARLHRLQQSLSDMNGYDPYVHFNRIDGMFDAACDMFVGLRPFPVPTEKGFRKVYRSLRVFRQHQYGTKSVYTPARFAELVVAGRQYVEQFSTV